MNQDSINISGISSCLGGATPIAGLAETDQASVARIAALGAGGFENYTVLAQPFEDASVEVAQRTLRMTSTEASEVDAVIYEEGKLSAVGLALHRAIDIKDVPLLGLGGQGSSVACAALRLARDMVQSGSARNVLVILGDQRDALRIGVADATVLSDGVCSLLVSRRPGNYRVLAADVFTNGSAPTSGRPQQDFLQTYQCLERLSKRLYSQAKLSSADIGVAFSSHLKHQFWTVPAETSGVSLKKFFSADLPRYAHTTFDNFACLESWMAGEDARPGTRLLLLNWAQLTYSGAILEYTGREV